MLRNARDDRAFFTALTDDTLRRTHSVRCSTRARTRVAPSDWRRWITQSRRRKRDPGGTAGVADEKFYGSVKRYLDAAKAPPTVRFTVDFYHGLAAWTSSEAAHHAGDQLMVEKRGMRGIAAETLRRGLALASSSSAIPAGARAVYASLAKSGPWRDAARPRHRRADRRAPSSAAKQP